jgi:hypothetical protein
VRACARVSQILGNAQRDADREGEYSWRIVLDMFSLICLNEHLLLWLIVHTKGG